MYNMDNTDNVTLMAMVRSGLCFFYLTLGTCFVVLNERKEEHKYVLGILLMILGFGMARDAISRFYPILTETFYFRLSSLIDLTVVPLYAMFVFSLIYKKYLSFKRTIFNLLPFILLPCLFVVWKAPVVFYCGLAMPVLYAIRAVPNIFIGLKKYEKAIVDNYSYQCNINAEWLKAVVWLLVINLLFSLYIYQYPSDWLYWIYYAYGLLTYSGGYSATDSGDTRPPLLELQRYQYFFLILSPFSSKRRDLCAILSRQASASISLLKTPYQSDTASWLDRINDFL